MSLDFKNCRIVVPKSTPPGTSYSLCIALANTIDKKFVVTDDVKNDDVVILGGSFFRTEFSEYVKNQSINFLCVEKGYLNWGKKNKFRITPNYDQTLFVKEGYDDKQFKKLMRTIKPWQHGDNIIIVCPSEDVTQYYYKTTVDRWLEKIINELKVYTNKNIIIRKKSSKKERKIDLFVKALNDCHCVITMHSMAAAEALCEGVPVFYLSKGTFTEFSSDDLKKINEPFYTKNREKLFNCLSYLQFSTEEIKSGVAWENTKKYFSINY